MKTRPIPPIRKRSRILLVLLVGLALIVLLTVAIAGDKPEPAKHRVAAKQLIAAKALIEAGADLKTTNKEGSTPLHIAAFFCRTDIVKALLDKGADKTAKNNFGSTPIQSVTVPFEAIKGFYDGIGKGLKGLGLKLDYERIKQTRPKIAELLQEK